jgi:hypothetical protein
MQSSEKVVYVDWQEGSLTPPRSLETRIGVFASTLGAIIACIAYYGGYVAVRTDPISPIVDLIARIIFIASIAGQITYVGLVWASLKQRGLAFGPAVVAMHPRIPWFLRPVVSLLWLLQFLQGCAFILVIEGFIHDPQSEIPARLWFIRALVAFACTYATYLYLLLAIGTMVRRKPVVQMLWRWRFIFDAGIALLLVLCGLR